MDGDEPPDVRAVLVQLFAEGRKAIEADDTQTAQSVIDSAETVVRNKVPDEKRRKLLLQRYRGESPFTGGMKPTAGNLSTLVATVGVVCLRNIFR